MAVILFLRHRGHVFSSSCHSQDGQTRCSPSHTGTSCVSSKQTGHSIALLVLKYCTFGSFRTQTSQETRAAFNSGLVPVPLLYGSHCNDPVAGQKLALKCLCAALRVLPTSLPHDSHMNFGSLSFVCKAVPLRFFFRIMTGTLLGVGISYVRFT